MRKFGKSAKNFFYRKKIQLQLSKSGGFRKNSLWVIGLFLESLVFLGFIFWMGNRPFLSKLKKILTYKHKNDKRAKTFNSVTPPPIALPITPHTPQPPRTLPLNDLEKSTYIGIIVTNFFMKRKNKKDRRRKMKEEERRKNKERRRMNKNR